MRKLNTPVFPLLRDMYTVLRSFVSFPGKVWISDR
jgi:hypothetical protein